MKVPPSFHEEKSWWRALRQAFLDAYEGYAYDELGFI